MLYQQFSQLNQVNLIIGSCLLSGVVSADEMVHNEMEMFPVKSMMPDEKAIIRGTPGAKRKHENSRLYNRSALLSVFNYY